MFLVANLGQAVPSIAALALAFTMLELGLKSAVIALVLYALLPILRNTSEFRSRPDGLPGLEKTDGGGYAKANYIDIGATAEALIVAGQRDAGQVFTTDSAIAANNLYLVQDDQHLFPPYNVGLIVRADVLKKNPAIANLMTPVAAKLTTAVMVNRNKQAEVDKKNVTDVARAGLQQNGFL